MDLCTHTLWAYASMLYGLMRPRFMDLRTHTLWAYAPMLYGLMRPYFMGLCVRALWAYASVLYGLMRPCSMDLCAPVLRTNRKRFRTRPVQSILSAHSLACFAARQNRRPAVETFPPHGKVPPPARTRARSRVLPQGKRRGWRSRCSLYTIKFLRQPRYEVRNTARNRRALERCFEGTSNYASTHYRIMLRRTIELCFDVLSNYASTYCRIMLRRTVELCFDGGREYFTVQIQLADLPRACGMDGYERIQQPVRTLPVFLTENGQVLS